MSGAIDVKTWGPSINVEPFKRWADDPNLERLIQTFTIFEPQQPWAKHPVDRSLAPSDVIDSDVDRDGRVSFYEYLLKREHVNSDEAARIVADVAEKKNSSTEASHYKKFLSEVVLGRQIALELDARKGNDDLAKEVAGSESGKICRRYIRWVDRAGDFFDDVKVTNDRLRGVVFCRDSWSFNGAMAMAKIDTSSLSDAFLMGIIEALPANSDIESLIECWKTSGRDNLIRAAEKIAGRDLWK